MSIDNRDLTPESDADCYVCLKLSQTRTERDAAQAECARLRAELEEIRKLLREELHGIFP